MPHCSEHEFHPSSTNYKLPRVFRKLRLRLEPRRLLKFRLLNSVSLLFLFRDFPRSVQTVDETTHPSKEAANNQL